MRDELSEQGSGNEKSPAPGATISFIPYGNYRSSVVKMTAAMAKAPRPALEVKRELDRRLHEPKTAANADVPSDSTNEHIGQVLRRARLKKGEELSDIWRTLKIPEHHLIAIEEGRFASLPGRPYTIGFVRSYATYLGLDAEDCVERLKFGMTRRVDPDPSSLAIAKHDDSALLPSGIDEHDRITALNSGSAKHNGVTALHSDIAKRDGISARHSKIANHNAITELRSAIAKHAGMSASRSAKSVDSTLRVSEAFARRDIHSLPPKRTDRSDTVALHSLSAERLPPEPDVGLYTSPERNARHSGPIIIGMFLVVLMYAGYHGFISAVRTSQPPPVMPVPERLAAEAGLPQRPVAESPPAKFQQQAPIVPVEPALPAPPELASPEPVSVPALAPTPAPTQSISVTGLTQVVSLPPPAEPVAEPAAAEPVSLPAQPAPKVEAPVPNGRYGAQNRNSRITLRVHRRTRVAVLGPRNRDFIDRILAPGETYRVPNVSGLRLTASDAGAVELILDGVSVGRAGQDGSRARGISLNLPNILDRRLR